MLNVILSENWATLARSGPTRLAWFLGFSFHSIATNLTAFAAVLTETMRDRLHPTKRARIGRNNTSLGLEELEESYFSLFIFCRWLRLYLECRAVRCRSMREYD